MNSLCQEDRAKLDILSANYQCLRAEAINRSNSRFVMPAFLVAIWAIALNQQDGLQIGFIIAASVASVVILFLWWLQGFWKRMCDRRIEEIRTAVAELTGEDLLRGRDRLRVADRFNWLYPEVLVELVKPIGQAQAISHHSP